MKKSELMYFFDDKNKDLIDSYEKILTPDSKSLVINRKSGRSKIYGEMLKVCVQKGTSVVFINDWSLYFSKELLSLIEKSHFEFVMQPSYNYIKSLDDKNIKRLIVLNNYSETYDYSATVEYALLACKKLVDLGQNVLIVIDGFEQLYACSDFKELYNDMLKEILLSNATVICSSDGAVRNSINIELFRYFQYIVTLKQFEDITKDDSLIYAVDKILGPRKIIMMKKMLNFEKKETMFHSATGRIYDMKSFDCRLFDSELRYENY